MSGAAVKPEEAAAARAARGAVGHALRDARHRRQHDDDRFGFHYPPAVTRPHTLPLRPSRFWIQVLSAIGLILLGLVIFWYPGIPGFPGGPAAPPSGAQQASPAATAIAGGGRGRTSATFAPVVLATPQSTASASPGPIVSAQPGTGPGAGTGSGTGTGIGSLPPRADSDYRIIFTVRDAQTGRPLKAVCVVFGSECDRGHFTDAEGVTYYDFPLEQIARPYTFTFVLQGYAVIKRDLVYSPGEPMPRFEIALPPSP